jgi:hypothetical protein
MRMRCPFARPTAAWLLAVLLALPTPLAAQSDGGDTEGDGRSAEEMAREGVERLMNALETFLGAIPQYGVPRIDEDGNIIIPRLDSPDDDGDGDAPQDGGPDDAPSGEGEDGPVETRI